MSDDDTRERLIKLEVEVENVEEKLGDISVKVSDMHDVLMQAKGARWFLISVAAFIGFITSEMTKAGQFLWHK